MKTTKEIQVQKELAKRVMNGVSEFTGIPVEDIVSSSRKAEVMEARHLSMYFMRSKTDLTLVDIAALHNKKNHVPVLHGLKKIENICSTEKAFSQRLAQLRAKLDSIKLEAGK